MLHICIARLFDLTGSPEALSARMVGSMNSCVVRWQYGGSRYHSIFQFEVSSFKISFFWCPMWGVLL